MTRFVALLGLALALACDRTVPPPEEPVAAGAHADAHALYQCPMHPQIIRREPGTCPICGMTLQRVDETAVASTDVPGHAAFTLSAERQQLIGVTHAPVAVRSLVEDIRTAGTIANDPMLYQALVEYREAHRTLGAIRDSSVHEARAGADALIDAAALKLRRLGLGEHEIAAFARLDPTTLLLPGAKVWVYAKVYEGEAPLIAAGTPLTVTVPALPGRSYDATVFAVDPTIDPATRTVRVRALVTTPDAELRPDAFVIVTIHVPLGDHVAVPREAVLDSGTRRLVFVVGDGGRFTPRAVRLGRLAQGYYEVQDGVAAGEEVVTSANFLIDSESRIQAAVAAFDPAPATGNQR
jgi:multidrug efflux pump subunit AcrA (membrane-fusion protein)